MPHMWAEERSEQGAVCTEPSPRPVSFDPTPAADSPVDDVIHRRLAQEQSRAARGGDALLATLAHELRNPLAPLRHGIQLARVAGRADAQLQDIVDMMDRQLSHLVRLADDLLDVDRIRSGKLQLQPRPVELAEILRHSLAVASADSTSLQVKFELDHRDSCPCVLADRDRLAQVFTRLLANAARQSGPGTAVAVRLEAVGDEAIVHVADRDSSLHASEPSQVVAPLAQARTPMDPADGGLGIGYTLVRGLVSLHGGSFSAHGDAAALGRRFTVRLPLLPAAHEPARGASVDVESTIQGQVAEALHILVADDNVDAGDSLATLLRLLGHDVSVARDGVEAVTKAGARHAHLILLDLGMPRMDGIEAARQLRRLPGGDRSFIVAVTGWGQAADRQRTHDAGFDLHLVKPIDEPMLLETIARVGRAQA